MYRGHRRRQPGLALMLLVMQMARVGFDHIPPVTLTTIVAQVAIFLQVINFKGFKMPGLSDVCISTVNVYYRQDYRRLFLAAFFHADEWHLYYNMVSFLWKSISLERRWGSGYILYLLVVFTLLCNSATVALGLVAEQVFHDPSYLSQCAVGFSGVLFALKVVTTALMPQGTQYVMGFFPVNSRLACWVELLAIQMLVPNASFIGHLAGILVGMAYTKGPLKSMMDVFVPTAPSYTYRSGTTSSTSSRQSFGGRTVGTGSSWWNPFGNLWSPTPRSNSRRFHGQGYTGTGSADGVHRADAYAEYGGGMTEEEQIQAAMERSLRDHHDQGLRPSPSAPPEGDTGPGTPPPPYSPHAVDPLRYPTTQPPPYPGTGHPTAPPTPFHVPDGSPTIPARDSQSTRLYPNLSEASSPPVQTTQYGWNVDQDEIRRRRLARFDARS